MKVSNNSILALCTVVLAVLAFMSVYGTIRFQTVREQRETAVKQRLVRIRAAEEAFRKCTGTYSNSFATLVKGGYLADSLQYIPFADGKRFELNTSVQLLKSGREIPLMECSAGYHDYLKGMDENAVSNLIQEANESGAFPGLRIGDITTPNNNEGNWE